MKRRVDGDERVALIFLDAFGLEFLERHRDHPLIERLDPVEPCLGAPGTGVPSSRQRRPHT
jgi:hypothetical protein